MDCAPEHASLDQPDGCFTLRDHDGVTHILPGVEGMSLMEILRAADFPIPATCGGAAACGTCHVYVEQADLSRLSPVGDTEQWQLEHLTEARATSRLSCQLVWHKERLDGISLTLAPQE